MCGVIGLLHRTSIRKNALHDMLSAEAREVIGPMKIRRQRSTPSVKKRREGCRHGSGGEAPRSYRIAPADEIQRLGTRFEL